MNSTKTLLKVKFWSFWLYLKRKSIEFQQSLLVHVTPGLWLWFPFPTSSKVFPSLDVCHLPSMTTSEWFRFCGQTLIPYLGGGKERWSPNFETFWQPTVKPLLWFCNDATRVKKVARCTTITSSWLLRRVLSTKLFPAPNLIPARVAHPNTHPVPLPAFSFFMAKRNTAQGSVLIKNT